MHFNEISGAVVDASMKVHTALGSGLLESVYQACLVHELSFRTAAQLPLPVNYDGFRIDLGFRLRGFQGFLNNSRLLCPQFPLWLAPGPPSQNRLPSCCDFIQS
jgi:PD-(D/E)XK nuclease superfamily protein